MRYSNTPSLVLVSNPLQMEQIVSDQDILKIQSFSKLSSLSISNQIDNSGGSNVSEKGLQYLNEGFPNLKEIDISKCKFISENGMGWLSGYKYVTIKANQI